MDFYLKCLLAAVLLLLAAQVTLFFLILRSALRPYANREILKNIRHMQSSVWNIEWGKNYRAWDRDAAVVVEAAAAPSPSAPLLSSDSSSLKVSPPDSAH